MINAKDIFNLEQEMVSDLVYQMYQAGFDSDEREQIFNEFNEMTEARYNELLQVVFSKSSQEIHRFLQNYLK